MNRRTLTWVRGLKRVVILHWSNRSSRTLTWVRGLKQEILKMKQIQKPSHPYMGAWIETTSPIHNKAVPTSRTLTWVRGLKHHLNLTFHFPTIVAPLHGCVD